MIIIFRIMNIINDGMRLIERVVPYSEAGIIQDIRKYGQLLEEEYQEGGIYIRARVPKNLAGKFE